MSYRDHFAQHLRLGILRELADAPAYQLSSTMLRDLVTARGQTVTHDQVKTEAAWLADQGLVDQETLGSVMAVTLTERGEDVARGRAVAPGVRRPSPGE